MIGFGVNLQRILGFGFEIEGRYGLLDPHVGISRGGKTVVRQADCELLAKLARIALDGVGRPGAPVALPAGPDGQHGGLDPVPVVSVDGEDTPCVEKIAGSMSVDERHKLAGRNLGFKCAVCFQPRFFQITMTRLIPLLALVAAFGLPPATAAADQRFARLSEPGIVAIMRHALAPGSGDTASFALDDCATQRNLDAQGREQARAIGAAIQAAGATVDRILTSQWCRCRDTAELLGLGPVDELPALNSFFRNPDRADPQTADLRQFLLSLPPEEAVILVTHYVNIRALTGRGVASGEVVLLKIGNDRMISVVDEILIDHIR